MLAALAVVLTHAHVLTLSPIAPVASSLAVVDGAIAYVGNDEAAARRAGGRAAEVLDLGGHTVIPGFNDAHVHFGDAITIGGARGIYVPKLPRREWLAEVLRGARARPGHDWLFVTSPELPAGLEHGRELEALDRPTLVVTARGGIANRRAATLCRLGPDEAPGGFIPGRDLAATLDRAVKSLPLGVLLDEARDFLALLARSGITSVQLIDELPDVFETLRRQGRLTARVRMVTLGHRFAERLYHSDWTPPAPDWLRIDAVKYYSDDNRIPRFELEAVYEETLRQRRPVLVHILSRSALARFLDVIERLARTQPAAAALFRVEHVDEATRVEGERLARLGIMVCSNPAMIPETRGEHAFPLRTLVDAGVKLCFGTDYVGEHHPPRPIAPLSSLALAVTHGGHGESERLSAAEALFAYTAGSAAGEGMERNKGRLTVGRFADLTVLSGDPTQVAPEKIAALEVLMTMVGGRIVYRSPALLGPPVSTIGPATIGPATPKPPAPPPTIGPARPPKGR